MNSKINIAKGEGQNFCSMTKALLLLAKDKKEFDRKLQKLCTGTMEIGIYLSVEKINIISKSQI